MEGSLTKLNAEDHAEGAVANVNRRVPRRLQKKAPTCTKTFSCSVSRRPRCVASGSLAEQPFCRIDPRSAKKMR